MNTIRAGGNPVRARRAALLAGAVAVGLAVWGSSALAASAATSEPAGPIPGCVVHHVVDHPEGGLHVGCVEYAE